MYIARQQFSTPLNLHDSWDELADDLSALMSAGPECRSAGCNGGPCNPTFHIFQPTEYSPTTASDEELLLELSQGEAGPDEHVELSEVSWAGGASSAGAQRPQPGSRSLGEETTALRSGRHGDRFIYAPRPPLTAQAHGNVGNLKSAVDQLTLLVRSQPEITAREREKERVLRNKQIRNNDVLAAVLKELAVEPAPTESSSQATGGKSRVSLVPHPNPAALALTGCAVAPKFAIIDDPASVDLKEFGHGKAKSGRNAGVRLDAPIHESWPNEYLRPLKMDGRDPRQLNHNKITLVQWAGGFVGKIFAEFPETRNNSREHNQLFVLMKMLRLAETQPWAEVGEINQALFSALEQGVLTWRAREALEKWLALAVKTVDSQAAHPRTHEKPPPAATPRQPPAEKVDSNVGGIFQ